MFLHHHLRGICVITKSRDENWQFGKNGGPKTGQEPYFSYQPNYDWDYMIYMRVWDSVDNLYDIVGPVNACIVFHETMLHYLS